MAYIVTICPFQLHQNKSKAYIHQANHDRDGSISYANYQSCAIALSAVVTL